MSQFPYEQKTRVEQQPAHGGRSNVVTARRFAMIYETPAWGNRRLGRVTALAVYHALLLYANTEGFYTIRIKRLATLFGVSDRAIQYHLASLIKCGLVRRFTQHRPEGGLAANRFWIARSGIPVPHSDVGLHPPGEGDLHPAGEKDLHQLARAQREPRRTDQLEQKEGDLKKSEPVLGRCAPASAEWVLSDQCPERYEAFEGSSTCQRALELHIADLGRSLANSDPGAAKVIHDRAAYAHARDAATRRNMLKRLKGFCMRELAGTEQRQAYALIQRAAAIVDDHAAWLGRSAADKQALTALREQAQRFKAVHGWLPSPVELDAWEVMAEDRLEARKYLADVAEKLNRELLQEYEKRQAGRLTVSGHGPEGDAAPISNGEISD